MAVCIVEGDKCLAALCRDLDSVSESVDNRFAEHSVFLPIHIAAVYGALVHVGPVFFHLAAEEGEVCRVIGLVDGEIDFIDAIGDSHVSCLSVVAVVVQGVESGICLSRVNIHGNPATIAGERARDVTATLVANGRGFPIVGG